MGKQQHPAASARTRRWKSAPRSAARRRSSTSSPQLIRGKKVEEAMNDPHLLAQAHGRGRARCSQRDRQCREQPRPRRRRAGRRRGDVGKSVMKRFATARPRPVGPDREAVQPARSSFESEEKPDGSEKSIRSACACRSTAPGTAAGSRKASDYGKLLHEDSRSASTSRRSCQAGGVSKVVIERPHKKCRVTIYAARPGVIIGKKGADIEKLRKKLAR
jgi:hypothetical protein